MPICFFFEFAMERKNVVHQVVLELLHVFLLAFAAHKFFPCAEQILDGDDTLVTMSELDPPNRTPPQRLLPVIEHTVTVYKRWQEYRDHFPKKSRYTLADRIDALFIQILELLFVGSYQSKSEKLPTIAAALRKSDVLKFLLRIAWETHALDTKKYAAISEEMRELGRMIGGWKKGLESKTPAP